MNKHDFSATSWEELNNDEKIKKLEQKRDFFPEGTGFYQKYNNSIKALKKIPLTPKKTQQNE